MQTARQGSFRAVHRSPRRRAIPELHARISDHVTFVRVERRVKTALGVLLIASMAVACAPGESGAVGTLSVSGGPPGHINGGESVVVMVSAPGRPTINVPTTGGASTRIPLEPGDYTLAGQFGNAGCSSVTIHVSSGSWASFELVCSIR